MPRLLLQMFRVYYDRLVDDADREWLFSYARDVCKEKLKEDFDQLFSHLDSDGDGKVRTQTCSILEYRLHKEGIIKQFTWFPNPDCNNFVMNMLIYINFF